jgi:PAS domain-containing protein
VINGDEDSTELVITEVTDNTAHKHAEEALLKAGALQRSIFNSANFSSIATDAKGVIQIFNVGAERIWAIRPPMSWTRLLRPTLRTRRKSSCGPKS